MNESKTEALAAIRFFAENGRLDNVYKMLIREFEYDQDAALDFARWLTEHPEHAEIWIATNEPLSPQIGFNKLLREIHWTGSIEYYIDRSFDQILFRQIKTTENALIEIITPLGRTVQEAFDYWEKSGYWILLPILNAVDK